jgi:Calcineurin-like phosphoesterase
MHISSKNKKIVIFSDVHHEVRKLDKILTSESADINICLGDWFDSHVRSIPSDYQFTAQYLLNYLNYESNITLFGNHDLNYLFDAESARCSGYSHANYLNIGSIISDRRSKLQEQFKWFVVLDNCWLLTHAGIHPLWLHNGGISEISLASVDAFLASQSETAIVNLRRKQPHWFFNAGAARGGRQVGGIVWLDFNNEFVPIQDLQQIVGHTHAKKIRCHAEEGLIDPLQANNICIDTNLNEYLVATNGKLEIKKYIDL